MTLARGRPLLCQQGIETALPGDITPLTSPMMFHEVARQILRLQWCRDRGIAVCTSIGANPRSRRDVRFLAERQRPIHFSLSAVVAAVSRRFGRPSEPLIFCRFGAIISSWTHAFPPAGRRAGARAMSLSHRRPCFFLILVVYLIWRRSIPIARRMRKARCSPCACRRAAIAKPKCYQDLLHLHMSPYGTHRRFNDVRSYVGSRE
jgi:hypothetical protein